MTAASVPSLLQRRRWRARLTSPSHQHPPTHHHTHTHALSTPPRPPPGPPSQQHTDICIFMKPEPQCEGRSVSAFCFSPAVVGALARLEPSNQSAPSGFTVVSFFLTFTTSSGFSEGGSLFSQEIYVAHPFFLNSTLKAFRPFQCKVG